MAIDCAHDAVDLGEAVECVVTHDFTSLTAEGVPGLEIAEGVVLIGVVLDPCPVAVVDPVVRSSVLREVGLVGNGVVAVGFLRAVAFGIHGVLLPVEGVAPGLCVLQPDTPWRCRRF